MHTVAQAASLLSISHALLPMIWALSYSCFTRISFFLLLLPFLCFCCYLKASFLHCFYLPWSLNSCQIHTTTKPFKSICSLFSPYLVYQHCQATFYYAGNKKCLQDLCQAHRMKIHICISNPLFFLLFLFTICLLIWFLCALRYNFTPVQIISCLAPVCAV